MLTSKQRAQLRAAANKIEPVFQVGKNGATAEVVEAVNEALRARELIKGNVLNNCTEDAGYIANIIGERTHSDVVQVIGKKIVLYRRNEKNPIIELK